MKIRIIDTKPKQAIPYLMSAQPTLKTIQEQINSLQPICIQLEQTKLIQDKLDIVDKIPAVNQFLQHSPTLQTFLNACDPYQKYVVKAILAIGQGEVLFRDLQVSQKSLFDELIQELCHIDHFYAVLGGIAGYHLIALQLLSLRGASPAEKGHPSQMRYEEPEGLDISQNNLQVREAIRWGIENIGLLAEFYPVGSAGDRLHLQEGTHFLPAAQLAFFGRTLLEGLIRDLQAREFLHYKLFRRQHCTPLAIMTSHEKDNHERIKKIFFENDWFGRPRDSIRLFIQPLVPMVTQHGFWAVHGPLKPILKPGGHGLIWKAAFEQGIFTWLTENKRTKALVRQINNPAAGCDNGLLAFAGLGCNGNKDFGFASCPRILSMPEGMDVLLEKKVEEGYEYCITNVEYTEFQQAGIKDIPKEPGSHYSLFPANTNILFIDTHAVKSVIESHPIPGLIINMKSKTECMTPGGKMATLQAGRLESTMQNVADYITDRFPTPLQKGKRNNLRTFITYNARSKTLSVAKQAYEPGQSIRGTPEGCYFELLKNYHELFTQNCGLSMPGLVKESEYLEDGPPFIIDIHPALGPLYSVIAQKIRGGSLAKGSELILEIAEADISNLTLDGSLLIEAEGIMGQKNFQSELAFDDANCGKCSLINVKVKNQGIDRSKENIYWSHKVHRNEALHITLHGNGEFYAENVEFEGGMAIDVPDGYSLTAYQEEGRIIFQRSKIEEATWKWVYTFDENSNIILTKGA